MPAVQGGSFDHLVAAIREIHDRCATKAAQAVNIALTLRNWAIGFHILEYEQNGSDRAAYGERLLERLADDLAQCGMSRVDPRELRRYRQFCLVYPGMRETLTPELVSMLPPASNAVPEKRETLSPELTVPPESLVSRLSFSHLAELITIEEPLKRAFYEMECIHGSWSVRELKRQIGSLYFERSGLSRDKAKLAETVRCGAETADPRLVVRDPYVFEFLGLEPREVMGESQLEDALLDRIQDFLLELGNGFCFEARQKRIVIGETHNFIDLVFYHRILKCHVLLELKVSGFSHENMGQLNTYVSWYKRNMMSEGDNPPVGILLCTRKDAAVVEYALADMDNSLFVSKYQLELPDKRRIERFLAEQLEIGGIE
jgi:predicted nuclease of restriction endonuclease-like (RecB) superfamily